MTVNSETVTGDPEYKAWQSPALEPSTDPNEKPLKRTSPINRTRNQSLLSHLVFASVLLLGFITPPFFFVQKPMHFNQALLAKENDQYSMYFKLALSIKMCKMLPLWTKSCISNERCMRSLGPMSVARGNKLVVKSPLRFPFSVSFQIPLYVSTTFHQDIPIVRPW